MATTAEERPPAAKAAADFDVLIIGAGVSGIGSAWHLQQQTPGTSFAILDDKDIFGGTWVTHKYPGIRSDSDLYTYGYRFKPWVDEPIASGAKIRRYMQEVINDYGIAPHIRYGHKVERVEWSDATHLWTVHGTAKGKPFALTTNFLWMCQGYFRHDQGYIPDWPDLDKFRGPVIHPQNWPDDVQLAGKRVIVIGSGATAATLVPAIAGECAHVTMLQRSPTYFYPAPNEFELVTHLRNLGIDESWIHEIARRDRLLFQAEMARRSLEEPEAVRAELLEAARQLLPEGYDIQKHFSPRYRPWQQRLAAVPDGDLFAGISSGAVDVVTDEIERFTETGIALKSGEQLEADIIIAATGFNLCVDGGIAITVNGKPIELRDTITYRGMMFTGIPNYVWVMGYFRASWTLRVDMLGDFVTRLLRHMKAKGVSKVEVALRPEDRDMELTLWPDPEDFNPGYMMRNQEMLPRRGTKHEWMHNQDYWTEREEFPAIDLDGAEFRYS